MTAKPQETYRVILCGLMTTTKQESARVTLAKLFKTTPETIDKLLSSPNYVLKSGLSFEVAAKYKAAITASGGVCEIEQEDDAALGGALQPSESCITSGSSSEGSQGNNAKRIDGQTNSVFNRIYALCVAVNQPKLLVGLTALTLALFASLWGFIKSGGNSVNNNQNISNNSSTASSAVTSVSKGEASQNISRIPSFTEGEAYLTFREKLLSASLVPVAKVNAENCDQADSRCVGRPEIDYCAGFGCRYLWRQGNSVYVVYTDKSGDGVYGVEKEGGVNKSNDQLQQTVFQPPIAKVDLNGPFICGVPGEKGGTLYAFYPDGTYVEKVTIDMQGEEVPTLIRSGRFEQKGEEVRFQVFGILQLFPKMPGVTWTRSERVHQRKQISDIVDVKLRGETVRSFKLPMTEAYLNGERMKVSPAGDAVCMSLANDDKVQATIAKWKNNISREYFGF